MASLWIIASQCVVFSINRSAFLTRYAVGTLPLFLLQWLNINILNTYP